MADHDDQDPATDPPDDDSVAEIRRLRRELQIANLMLADLSAALSTSRLHHARATAIIKLTQPPTE